jgi:hypothetical protein
LATGKMHADVPPEGVDRFQVCVQLGPEAGPLAGSKIYVPDSGMVTYSKHDRFALYLVSDPSLTAVQASQVPVSELLLNTTPLLDLAELDYYELTTHTVHWTGLTKASLIASLPNVGVQGVPFVVVLDGASGERIYMGAFMTALSSIALNAPTVVIEDMTDDSMQILAPKSGPDPRADPALIKELTWAWKLAP